MKPVPPYASTTDWPRKVSQALDALDRDKFTKASFGALGNYADDVAAAAAGVAIGSLYRTGSAVKVRVA